MIRLGSIFTFFILCLFGSRPAGLAQSNSPQIDFPKSGQAVQGIVTITGSTDIYGFKSSEVAFAYESEAAKNWFILAQADQPVQNDALSTWDTSTITDGTYSIRLNVSLQDGSTLTTIVDGIRVRNETPIETDTPPAATPTPDEQIQIVEKITPTLLNPPATPLPPNPARIDQKKYRLSLAAGAISVLVFLICLSIYLLMRRWQRYH